MEEGKEGRGKEGKRNGRRKRGNGIGMGGGERKGQEREVTRMGNKIDLEREMKGSSEEHGRERKKG